MCVRILQLQRPGAPAGWGHASQWRLVASINGRMGDVFTLWSFNQPPVGTVLSSAGPTVLSLSLSLSPQGNRMTVILSRQPPCQTKCLIKTSCWQDTSVVGKSRKLFQEMLNWSRLPRRPRGQFLRHVKSGPTRSLLYLRNDLGATYDVQRTGFRPPAPRCRKWCHREGVSFSLSTCWATNCARPQYMHPNLQCPNAASSPGDSFVALEGSLYSRMMNEY